MKTHPILRPDGSLRGFEVTSAWITFRPLFKILRSVDGITNVRRNSTSDDRILFEFRGHPGVVNEPWGDNSCYWVGLDPDMGAEVDIAPILEAFERYRGFFRL